jgi:type IV secretion system protein VirB10
VPEKTQTPEATDVHASPNSPSTPALRDRRVVPDGVVPKQAQGYVVTGLAVLILLAVMFSKNHVKTTPAVLPPSTTPFSSDAKRGRSRSLSRTLPRSRGRASSNYNNKKRLPPAQHRQQQQELQRRHKVVWQQPLLRRRLPPSVRVIPSRMPNAR